MSFQKRSRPRRELGELADALAVRVGIEPGRVDEHGRDARGPGADDVHVVDVADVDGRRGRGAGAIERNLKEARIRLLDLLEERVEHDVHQRRESEAIERAMERAVRVGHDDQLQAARAQRRERLRDAGRHELPEVVLLVVFVELGQRLRGRVRERHAGGRQHEVEVRPPALCVVRRLDRLAGVDLLLGVGLRRGQRLGRDADAALPQGVRDADPVRKHEHAARVEEHGLEHGASLTAARQRSFTTSVPTICG